MKIFTAEEMHKLDSKAIKQIGIPEMVLMENAGAAITTVAEEFLTELQDKLIVVLTGKGNNGGDGLVAARMLAVQGAFVKVVALTPLKEFKGSAAEELKILKAFDVPVLLWTSNKAKQEEIIDYCSCADLIIDAMLGTGFKGELSGNYEAVVENLSDVTTPVLAVDIPSGVEADTGKCQAALQAELTVTMIAPKLGMYIYPGAGYCGQIFVADLQTPPALLEEGTGNIYTMDADLIQMLLPARPKNAHKGMNGHVNIIAGSVGYAGAAELCSKAAVRAGGGLVSVYTDPEVWPILSVKSTEAMIHPLPTTSLADVISTTLDADVLAIGPGMGKKPETQKLIRELLPELGLPMVIDADGLNALAGHDRILTEIPTKVITPHPGEMARLMKISTKEVLAAPIQVAVKAAKKFRAVVVLKSTPTIVALPNEGVFINTTGNEGMATGGCGDVLTGTIAALLGQGLTPETAAICGVYVHGLAGDQAAENGTIGLKAGDLIEHLPSAIKEIMEKDQE